MFGNDYKCQTCATSFKTEQNLNEHVKALHDTENVMDIDEAENKHEENEIVQQSEVMEIDEPEEEVKEHEELVVADKRGENENEKHKEENEDNEMKAETREESSFPPNVMSLPENIRGLVNKGDLMFIIPGDGACAPNSGAAHIFQDPKYGPQFRMLMNNHVADNFSYYRDLISFPYKRKVGVKGDSVNFETEEQFCQFLRTSRSAYLWSDCEDLKVMANLYQMQIKVIKIKDYKDENPMVTFISPAPELISTGILPAGKVPDLVLLHIGDQHYNLIISEKKQFGYIW